MTLSMNTPEFLVERDLDRCIKCQVCVGQCANEVHKYDKETDSLSCDDLACVGCHRCVTLCPTHALTIKKFPLEFRENANWTANTINAIYKQAESGGILLTGMGNDKPYPIYWDHLLLNASQVTNPSIDPLREPMEVKTYLGRKPDKLDFSDGELVTEIAPQVELELPIMFSAMSFGSISLNAVKSLAAAAKEVGTMFNTGEGGLHQDLYSYGDNAIVQVASGRFGVHPQQPVLDANGVVGQVIRSLPFSSEIMLITDPNHAIPVQVNRNGLLTIAVGSGQMNRLNLPFLPNNADIRTGDLLITSGLGGTFPQGYPVAVVDQFTPEPSKPFASITATPKAMLDRNRELLIVWSNTNPIPLTSEATANDKKTETPTHE